MHQVRLLEGTFKPFTYFEKLKQSEQVKGVPLRIVLIIGLSILLSAVSSYIGISTEEIMKAMDTIEREKLEFAKLYFGAGEVLSGLFFPLFSMLFFSLFFWPFFNQIRFIYMFTIQLFPVFLLIIEKMVNIPLFYFLGIGKESSPIGFGVLIQLISEQAYLVNLISHLTIFQIWAACLQIIALRKMSDVSKTSITVTVIVAHLIYILILTTSTFLIQEIRISL